jgi:hypothetical protein
MAYVCLCDSDPQSRSTRHRYMYTPSRYRWPMFVCVVQIHNLDQPDDVIFNKTMLDIIETKYVFRHFYLFENVYVLFRSTIIYNIN